MLEKLIDQIIILHFFGYHKTYAVQIHKISHFSRSQHLKNVKDV